MYWHGFRAVDFNQVKDIYQRSYPEGYTRLINSSRRFPARPSIISVSGIDMGIPPIRVPMQWLPSNDSEFVALEMNQNHIIRSYGGHNKDT